MLDSIDNAFIFIDEFDSTKETMLKSIIKDNLRDKIDLIELFKTIHSALKIRKFPSAMMEISKKQIEEMSQKAEEIYRHPFLTDNRPGRGNAHERMDESQDQ